MIAFMLITLLTGNECGNDTVDPLTVLGSFESVISPAASLLIKQQRCTENSLVSKFYHLSQTSAFCFPERRRQLYLQQFSNAFLSQSRLFNLFAPQKTSIRTFRPDDDTSVTEGHVGAALWEFTFDLWDKPRKKTLKLLFSLNKTLQKPSLVYLILVINHKSRQKSNSRILNGALFILQSFT